MDANSDAQAQRLPLCRSVTVAILPTLVQLGERGVSQDVQPGDEHRREEGHRQLDARPQGRLHGDTDIIRQV